MINMVDYIGLPATLEQSAEEAAELAQACLKMARKLRCENYTPKTYNECMSDLIEEMADVKICMESLINDDRVASDSAIESVMIQKEKRFLERHKLITERVE